MTCLLLRAIATGALAAAVSTCAPAGEQPRLLAPAGATTDAAPPVPPEGTGVSGRVVTWPSCPAESGQQDCAPKPIAARIVVLRSTGQPVATLDVAKDGWIQVAVPVGAYVIETEAAGMLCARLDVTVPAHGYADVEVRCDTGVQ